MKKFKKIMSCFVIAGMLCTPLSANMPVIDIANLMNAVTELYAIYDQVNSAVEQVKNTYEQLNAQYKAMMSMSWDDLEGSFNNWNEGGDFSAAWDNIGRFRTNLTNATSIVNSNLNLINDVKNTLRNKTTTIGGKEYSVAGLFGMGEYGENNLFNIFPNTLDWAKSELEEAAKGWEGELTLGDKQRIMSQWGLDPQNYYYYKVVEDQVVEGMNQIFTKGSEEYYSAKMDEMAKNNEALLEISNQAGDSTTGQIQATQGIILSTKTAIANLEHGVAQFADMIGKKYFADSMREQAEADAKYAKEQTEAWKQKQNLSSFADYY